MKDRIEHGYYAIVIRSLPAALILCVTFAFTATADWRYSRWGMTPQQVTAASKGQARPYLGDPRLSDPTLSKKLEAPYVTGRFTFRAVFVFESRTNRLVAVHLVLERPELCRELWQSIIAEYGPPIAADNVGGQQGTWRDTSKRNLVSFVSVDLLTRRYCELAYRVLGQSGL